MRARDLYALVLILLMLGVAFSIGVDIVENVGEQSDSVSYTDETVTIAANNTFTSLDHVPIAGIDSVKNTSSGGLLQSGHYTFDKWTGLKLYLNDSDMHTGGYTVNYSAWTGSAYRTAENASKGFMEFASWQDTIALVAAAAVIISLITGAFLLRRGAAV